MSAGVHWNPARADHGSHIGDMPPRRAARSGGWRFAGEQHGQRRADEGDAEVGVASLDRGRPEE